MYFELPFLLHSCPMHHSINLLHLSTSNSLHFISFFFWVIQGISPILFTREWVGNSSLLGACAPYQLLHYWRNFSSFPMSCYFHINPHCLILSWLWEISRIHSRICKFHFNYKFLPVKDHFTDKIPISNLLQPLSCFWESKGQEREERNRKRRERRREEKKKWEGRRGRERYCCSTLSHVKIARQTEPVSSYNPVYVVRIKWDDIILFHLKLYLKKEYSCLNHFT